MAARTILVLAVVVAGMPACSPGSHECSSIALGPVAAAGTASCAEAIVYQGRHYAPWCAPVRPAFIGADAGLTGGDVNVTYTAKLIDGVPPEDALALRTDVPNAPKTERAMRRECGVWAFAPSDALSRADAKALAKRIAAPDSPALK